MRARIVRVRRRHARSMRLAMAFLLFALAVYLLSFAFHGRPLPPAEPDDNAVLSLKTDVPPVARVTTELRFEALSAYLISLGAEDSADAARVEAARYVLRGAAGYVLQDGAKFAVIGACYDSNDDAQGVAQRLRDQEQLDCAVVPLTAPPVALRVTATQPQIDALASAERCLRAACDAQGQISMALDAGQLTVEGAVNRLSAARIALEANLNRLQQVLGATTSPIALGILALVQDQKTALDGRIAQSDPSALSFSAKIKYNRIAARVKQIAFQNGLVA